MTELAVWLVVGTFILAIFVYAWPILLLIAGVCVFGWLAGKCIQSIEDGIARNRETQNAIVARADHQHAQIMSGDEIGGTYGIYQPPVGLR